MAMIRHPKDFFAGLVFIAFGVGAIAVESCNAVSKLLHGCYALGSAARMGPGYFPRILGILLILLGSILALRALRLNGSPIAAWKWRPTVVVLGSVVLFGLIVNSAGLVLSTILLIVIASTASLEFRPKEAAISAVLLAALCVGIFVIGLKLQIGIWPGAR